MSRVPPCKWSEREIEIIEENYPTTMPEKMLGLLLGKNHRQIIEKAHHLGVEKEKRIRRRITGRAMRKHFINQEFFSEWGHHMAYVLGFIFADGHIDPDSYRLEITIKDKSLLQEINHSMDSEYPLRKLKNRSHQLAICSMRIYEDLVSYGLSHDKAGIKYPDVPEMYEPSFVRGFFDGDGSVFTRWSYDTIINTSITSSSLRFLEALHKKAQSLAGVRGGSLKKRTNANAHALRYGHHDSMRLANWMYSTLGPCLERKKEVFEHVTDIRSK